MKLALGCYEGNITTFHRQWIDESWVLSDINPRQSNIKQVDARSIPFQGLEAIYASHVVEHIEPEDLESMFKSWFESLAKDGYIIINVPDMEWIAEEIINIEKGETPRSVYFTNQRKLFEAIFGNVGDTPFDKHRWGFTQNTLKSYVENAGFKIIKLERVYEAHDIGCIILEAKKC